MFWPKTFFLKITSNKSNTIFNCFCAKNSFVQIKPNFLKIMHENSRFLLSELVAGSEWILKQDIFTFQPVCLFSWSGAAWASTRFMISSSRSSWILDSKEDAIMICSSSPGPAELGGSGGWGTCPPYFDRKKKQTFFFKRPWFLGEPKPAKDFRFL